jgi:hypothetical protein
MLLLLEGTGFSPQTLYQVIFCERVGTAISTMVKDVVVSNDGTTTCDKKRGRPGEAPELTCRRCYQRVAISAADAKNYKWQDVVNAHAKKQCTPPQDSWQYRPIARAIGAPELRGLVFVARDCVDTEICVAALAEVKQFASWSLIDPREDGEGMCDNRRQRVVSQTRANRGTVKIRDAGKLVVQELSEALYGGYLRSEELLVLQLGNRCQRGHQDYMRDTNGKWQNDSATWFLCLAERRDLFLPGFGNVTLTQGDVAVLFANTWHAGVAEQAGAHGSEVLFGYFDRATNFSNAAAKFEVGPLLGDAPPDEYEVNIFACNKFSGLRRALRRELKIE